MAELSTATEIAEVDIGGAEYLPIREDATPGLLRLSLGRLASWIFGGAWSGAPPTDGDLLVWDTDAWVPTAPAGGPSAATECFIVALGDEVTDIVIDAAAVKFRMPYAFTLTEVRASLSDASSSGDVEFDISEGGVSILSTALTIDATETTSTTAAVPAVISDTALADDAELTFAIVTAGTDARGAKVYLIGHQ